MINEKYTLELSSEERKKILSQRVEKSKQEVYEIGYKKAIEDAWNILRLSAKSPEELNRFHQVGREILNLGISPRKPIFKE